jgi:glycosyltransferase involved in cell wall biosynthesis
MGHRMRIAWFSPLPPTPTGIAAYSSAVLPALDATGLDIDRFVDHASGTGRVFDAHDFVWRQRRTPYDLVVYQVGNAPWHDYMWAYFFHYPGLVVLHDARLHHARAAHLLRERRIDDYRREFAYDHPGAAAAAAEYAVEGLRGSAFYLWPMIKAVVDSARLVAVHNEFVAQELREQHPDARIERIRLGVAERKAAPGARRSIRRDLDIADESIVFVAFGLMTPEKRVEPILRALGAMAARGVNAHLLLVGANSFPALDESVAQYRLAGRVHVTGYVAEERIADYLSAADVSLALRWPTAEETSAAWIDSLAAAKPTIISLLPHTADVPALDARTWRPTRRSKDPIAVSVDLLDEDAALLAAMSRLADDGALRDTLAKAGHEYFKTEHRVELTAGDYRRVIVQAAALPAPSVRGLPPHLTNDYSARATSIARDLGVESRLW